MGEKPHILLVGENLMTVKTLAVELSREGFSVDVVDNAENAISKIERRMYDLIVLNPVAPGMKGLDLCRTLKNDPKTAKMPIIMISERKDEIDAVLSLEIGADDYMTEPLNIKELVARIKAVLRRTHTKPPDTNFLQMGEIVIDKEQCIVRRNGERIALTALSYKLLCFLAERRGKVFSRKQLLEEVWQQTTFAGLRTVDVHIRKLREKIEQNPANPEYIKTFHGIGYFFTQE